MQPFSGTRIVVNYNMFTAAEAAASATKWERRHQAQVAADPKLRALIAAERREAIAKYGGYSEYRVDIAKSQGTAKDRYLDEIARDAPSAEGKAYESEVIKLLASIQRTTIGSLVLRSFNKDHKVWIVPTKGEDGSACDCVAATTPGVLDRRIGGGVRLYFTPIPGQSKDNYYASDDVLFHELVHAYRATWLTTQNHRNRPMRDYKSEEEVLAVYMTNVYRAVRGDRNFYRAHLVSTLQSKPVLYEYLAADPEVFAAFCWFVKNDGLAKKVARWTTPDFNPWRDFPQIEKRKATRIDL